MDILLFLLSVILGLVSFVFLVITIINLIRKKHERLKRNLILLGLSSVLSFSLFVGFVIVIFNEEPLPNESQALSALDTTAVIAAEEKKKAEEEEAKKEAAAKDEAEEEAKAEEQRLKEEAAAKEKAEEEAKEKAAAEKKKQTEEKIAALGLVVATVSDVVDGDTITLSDGSKVRLIGVNTPESTNKTEEYGKEASNYTTKALKGKTVYLQKDVSETDRYGRLLRLVWIDIPSDTMNETEMRTKLFNAKLVLDGYAEPSTYNPDVTYSEYFKTFAREARESSTGLWAIASEGTTKGDFDTVTPVTSTSSNNNSNMGSSSTSSSGSESYANCTALKAVYPGGVAKDHPAYESKHDRDKDGWACESDSSAGGSEGSTNSSTVTTTPPPAKEESFKNCTAMREVYPSGVGKDHPAYASKHDRDKDGWACE